jgi:hypothetical protein
VAGHTTDLRTSATTPPAISRDALPSRPHQRTDDVMSTITTPDGTSIYDNYWGTGTRSSLRTAGR